MASRVFQSFKYQNGKAAANLLTGTFNARLLDTATSAGTDAQSSITTVSNFSVLSELAGTGYAKVVMTTLAWARVDSGPYVKWSMDNVAFGALASNNNTIKGMLVVFQVGGSPSDSADIPVLWDEFATGLVTDGSLVTIQINANGLLQLA